MFVGTFRNRIYWMLPLHSPTIFFTVNLVDRSYVEPTTFLVCSVSCEPDRLTVNLVEGKAGKHNTYDRSKEFYRIHRVGLLRIKYTRCVVL